jgi:hypothetical protein
MNSLSLVETPTEVETIINLGTQKVQFALIQTWLNDVPNGPNETTKILLQFPRQTIFRFMIDNSYNRVSAARIARSLFPTIPTKITLDDLPITLSDDLFNNLSHFLTEAKLFVSNLDYQRLFDPTESIEKHRFRLTQFIHFFKWLHFALNDFSEASFNFVLSLFEKCSQSSTESLDYNILNIVQFLSFFPLDLYFPHFPTLYTNVMDRCTIQHLVLVFFRRFERCIPYMILTDLQIVASHRSFGFLCAIIPTVFPQYREDYQVISPLIDDFVVYSDDPDIRTAILSLLSYDFAGVLQCPADYARLLEAVLDDIPNNILQIFVDIATNIYTESDLRMGCVFGVLLIREHRMDPSPSQYSQVLTLIGRSQESDLIGPVSDFLIIIARATKTSNELLEKIVQTMTGPITVLGRENLSSVLILVIVGCIDDDDEARANAMIWVLEMSSEMPLIHSSVYDALRRFSDEPAEWVKRFIMKFSPEWISDYGRHSKGLLFFEYILPSLSQHEVITIFTRLCESGFPETDPAWIIASTIFESFPSISSDLRQIFPLKNRPSNLTFEAGQAADVIFGRVTPITTDFFPSVPDVHDDSVEPLDPSDD